jgi:hypothetical protein
MIKIIFFSITYIVIIKINIILLIFYFFIYSSIYFTCIFYYIFLYVIWFEFYTWLNVFYVVLLIDNCFLDLFKILLYF